MFFCGGPCCGQKREVFARAPAARGGRGAGAGALQRRLRRCRPQAGLWRRRHQRAAPPRLTRGLRKAAGRYTAKAAKAVGKVTENCYPGKAQMWLCCKKRQGAIAFFQSCSIVKTTVSTPYTRVLNLRKGGRYHGQKTIQSGKQAAFGPDDKLHLHPQGDLFAGADQQCFRCH